MIKDISKYFIYLLLFCTLLTACSSSMMNNVEKSQSPIPQNETNTIAPTIKPTSMLQITSTPTPIFGYRIPEVSDDPEMDVLQLKAVVYSNSIKDFHLRFAFSEDGNSFILYSEGHISIWRTNPIEMLMEISFDDISHMNNFVISNDRKYLAVNYSISKQFEHQLIVWNLETMEVIRNITLESALLVTDQLSTFDYHEQGIALDFIPNTHKLVFANEKTIQIDNLDNKNDLVTIDLGENMFAEKISFPNDGRFIYVYMNWYQNHTIPSLYEYLYKVQIWDTKNHYLMREFIYPDDGQVFSVGMQFSYLLLEYPEVQKKSWINLENGEERDLPFRLGLYYITSNGQFIIYDRYFNFQEGDTIEFWTTDSWQNIYVLDYSTKAFQHESINLEDLHVIQIDKSNSILATSTGNQIYLLNISQIFLEK